jgi:uncharacterized glyoxalase superfamily protein PhnB
MADSDTISVLAELHYRDPLRSIAWLTQAFGFETRLLVSDASGAVVFSECGFGDHTVAIVGEQPPLGRSPASLGGVNTQTIQITGAFDVDAHCARARGAGAVIVQEPQTSAIGRAYTALDSEGHAWVFRQRISGPSPAMPEGWQVRFPSQENQ